jgi:hypothetical protein
MASNIIAIIPALYSTVYNLKEPQHFGGDGAAAESF